MDFLGPLDTARANLKKVVQDAFKKLDEFKAYPDLREKLEDYIIYCGGISILKTAENYLEVSGVSALKLFDLKHFTNEQIHRNVDDLAEAIDRRRAEIASFYEDINSGRYTDPTLMNSGWLQIDEDFNKARSKAFEYTNSCSRVEAIANDINTAVLSFLTTLAEIARDNPKTV